MQSSAATVDEYLASLPEDRKEALSAVRAEILKHLPKGYEEGMLFGMISYYIPLATYPDTYNKQPLCYAALASQKNYMSIYLMSLYGDAEESFKRAYKLSGKKVDMGKSCVRFKHLEDLPLQLIGQAITKYTPDEFIAHYQHSRI